MAQTIATPAARTLGVLATPFAFIGRLLINMAEAGPRMEQVRRLNALSDADLEALGTSRPEMVRRIFGGSLYL